MSQVAEIVKFVIEHRRNGVLNELTPAQIAQYVFHAINTNRVVSVTRGSHEVVLVVFASELDYSRKVVKIVNTIARPGLSIRESKTAFLCALAKFVLLNGVGWSFQYRRQRKKDLAVADTMISVERMQRAFSH